MHRYHYATLDAQAFLAACRVPAPGPDAYLAQDPETDALRELLDQGYRLLTLDPSSGLAVFEKALPQHHSHHLVRSMNALQAVRDLVAGVEQAIEHAQGKGWRSPDIESLLTNLIQKVKLTLL